MTPDRLRSAGARALADALAAGRRVDPATLAGWQWHGTSLGLPTWVERLSWKTFIKCFVREPDGRIRGWNVRVVQPWHDPGAAPYTPRRARGVPVTFGHFTVAEGAGGVVLDYQRAGLGRLDPLSALRDPLVALDAGGDRLLGRSLLAIAGRRVPTPSYFLLERAPAVDHAPQAPQSPTRWP